MSKPLPPKIVLDQKQNAVVPVQSNASLEPIQTQKIPSITQLSDGDNKKAKKLKTPKNPQQHVVANNPNDMKKEDEHEETKWITDLYNATYTEKVKTKKKSTENKPLSSIFSSETNNPQLFMYYLVESADNCLNTNNEPFKDQNQNTPSTQSVILSYPRLYLNSNKRVFSWIPYDKIIPENNNRQSNTLITTHNIIIENPHATTDARYSKMDIHDFEQQFVYVEKIKTSLTNAEMDSLINHDKQSGGDFVDIHYKNNNLTPNIDNKITDYMPYELLQKLGIDRFNEFQIKNVSGQSVNETSIQEYINILQEKMKQNDNQKNIYRYIHQYTDSTTDKYFLFLSNAITDELLKSDNIKNIITGTIIESEKPNITIVKILCVWLLIEKWIDLYITKKFNTSTFIVNQYWIENTLGKHPKNVANITEPEKTVYANWKTITIETYKLNVKSIQSKLTKLSGLDDTNFKNIESVIETMYDNNSYFMKLDNLLTQFLENMKYGDQKYYQEQVLVLIKDKNQTVESDRITAINKSLSSNNANEYTDYIKSTLLKDFSENISEYLRMNNLTDPTNVSEIIIQYICDSVSKFREKSGMDIWKEFNPQFEKEYTTDDKNALTNVHNTRNILFYLLAKNLDKYIKKKKVVKNKLQSVNNTQSDNSPSIEILSDDHDEVNDISDQTQSPGVGVELKDVLPEDENTQNTFEVHPKNVGSDSGSFDKTSTAWKGGLRKMND
jgi:hypothetical protein